MKTARSQAIKHLPLLLVGLLLSVAPVAAQTAFTYQGELVVSGLAGQGEFDFNFTLFDAATLGNPVGVPISLTNVEVRDGFFDAELDFGDVFDGTSFWLEIEVRESGALGPFETLSPRKALTSSTFSTFATEADNADTVDGFEADDMEVQNVELIGTTLRITEGTVVFDQELVGIVDDPDPTDELNTGLAFDGTDLTLTDAGGTLTADISSIRDGVDDADNDPANEIITSAELIGGLLRLIENGTVTNLVDVTALLNSGAVLNGTILEITDGGGTVSVDLAPIQDGVDDADNNPANELNTGLNLNVSTIEITDAGGTLTEDLSVIIDDADNDPANELIDSTALVGVNDTLRIVEAGVTNDTDVSALQNSALGLTTTTLSVTDGGGILSTDLVGLVDDADANPANELNTGATLNGTSVEITDAGGTLSEDLSVFIDDADADPANELIDRAALASETLANDTLRIVEAGNTNDIDVSALRNTSIQLNTTTLSVTDGGGTVGVDLVGLVDDADASSVNELNTGLNLNVSTIEITDAGGTLTEDLSVIIDDADADPVNELIDSAALINSGGTLSLVEAGMTNELDVTALQNSSINLTGTTLSVTDGGGTLAVDLVGVVDDADASSANELNTGMTLDTNTLRITDAGGTLVEDLSIIADGVNDPDFDPANELITSANLTNSAASLEIVEGGVTNTYDVSALLNSTLTYSNNIVQLTDGGGTLSEDLSAFAEANASMVLNGTFLEITDSAGTLSVDLASLDGLTDGDTDPNNELISSLSLVNGDTLRITEAGNNTDVDLSALATVPRALYDNFGWAGDSAPVGTGASGDVRQKVLEVVETATANRFEVDFNRLYPGTIIDSIPFTINESGFYYLTETLTASSGDGITINTDDVYIDLMGYALVGTTTGGGTGIDVTGNRTNINVRNGSLERWSFRGIDAFTSRYSIWSDLRVSNSDSDGLLLGDYNLVVRVTASGNGSEGISAGSSSSIFHCTADNNGGEGIIVDPGSVVLNSTASANGLDGIDAGFGSVVDSCSTFNNVDDGIEGKAKCLVVNSTARANGGDGIIVSTAGAIRSCVSSLNGDYGIRVSGDSQVLGNTAYDNAIDGFYTTGNGSYFEGNHAVDNDRYGYHMPIDGNFLVLNVAKGNGTNFVLSAGNTYGPIVDVSGGGDLSTITNADHPWANFEY